MFDRLVQIYNEASADGQEADWKTVSYLNKDDIWQALKAKLKSLDRNKYYFAVSSFSEINELIAAIRGFVDTDKRYNEIYGKTYSKDRYKDLINLAKVIALYQHELNYHRFLLSDDVLEVSVQFDTLYTKPHSELCALKNRDPGGPVRNFDIIPFADLMDEFKQSFRLRNFYNNQSLIPQETIAHPFCSYGWGYEDYCARISGSLSQPTYYALKDFVELVSNEFDAHNFIDGFFFQWRVAAKYRAFLNLRGYLESLPEAELAALHAVRIDGDSTFLSKFNGVVNEGNCVSVFADDLCKLLYQCDKNIQFINPRPTQMITEEYRNQLVLQGKVLDTREEDRAYLVNLQKIILNTTFKVLIGTGVVSAEGESNRVPSHVAEMFEICSEAIAGRMVPGEAKYKVIKVAAECLRNPHNSRFFFMNTRDVTTHKFYGMVIDREFSNIIAENDNLDNHVSFMA